MFKLQLLFSLLFISTQQLAAQKKSPLNFNVPKVDFVSAVTKTLGATNTIENTSLLNTKKEDTLITLKINNANALIKKKTNLIMVQQMDSIWLKTGQTLVGKITFDKDSNSFLFFKDTFRNIQLMPNEVSKLIVFPKKNEDERLDVLSIENEFYFLESDSKATIKIFANRTFKPILDDGPKHYFVESKYCLFKDNTPYLLNNGKSKDTLLFLMNDCKKVMDNFRMGIYTEDNFIEAIIQYNRCY
jgi:phage antirepressor YoqD-like protein